MNKIYEFLDTILNENDTVIVGVSTGCDSMALLDVLENYHKHLNIIVCHINHNVRKESINEYEYLKDYTNKHHLTLEYKVLNNLPSNNFEEVARKERYKFYRELYLKYHAKYILTAHHGDDNIETILMRLNRGSTLSGYLGIKLINNEYVRPLLYLTKEDLIEYCNKNNIKYFDDNTNFLDDHTRNRFRKYVIPFLKKENNKVHEKYLKYSLELQKYDNFVNDYINNLKVINNNIINLKIYHKESEFIKDKILENYIKILQENDLLNVNDNVLLEIKKLINNKVNGYINLNNNYIAIKEYDVFKIEKNNTYEKINEVFNDYIDINNLIIKKVDNYDKKDNYAIRLNSNDIKLPLIIRNRENGDYIYLNNGKKKIKDLLIDEKIPFTLRDKIILVCDSNNNVLWIPGIKKSKFDNNEKYDIILFSERKEENE